MSEVMSAELLQDGRTRDGNPSLEEFDYRPVSILASVTLSVSVVSVFAIFSLFGIMLALVGIVMSVFGFHQQKKHKGALGGKLLVRLGFFFSVLFFGWGIGNQVHAFVTELPEEHLRVNFYHDISAKELDKTEGGYYRVPEEIVDRYVNKKIFIKGFPMITRTLKQRASFVFLKDNMACCMGGSPKSWDKMSVVMQNGKKVDIVPGDLVSVTGVLRINPRPNLALGDTVYILEATKVEKSKSIF